MTPFLPVTIRQSSVDFRQFLGGWAKEDSSEPDETAFIPSKTND